MGDYAQFAQTSQDSASGIVDACGPGSPDSHRVVWGLTSRPPVSPAGFPPVSRLPAGFSPFARLLLVSRRPAFSGSSPSAVARFRFPFGVPPGSLPLSNLHDNAAAGRFRRHWSRTARAKVTSPAAAPHLDLAVICPALQMGCRYRIACYERPRAQDTAAPEPPRSAVIGRDPSSRVDHVMTSPSGGSPMRRSPGVRAPSHELAPETPICADEGCRRGPGRRRCALRSSPCSGAYCAATWPSPG